jgi:hypothetical protein
MVVRQGREKTGRPERCFRAPETRYPLTDKQKYSLEWLIHELAVTLKVQLSEVFRHPEVSRKTPTEAISSQEIISKLQEEASGRGSK